MHCRLQLVPLRCPLFGLRPLLRLSLPERLFKLVAPLVEPAAFAFGCLRGLGEPVPFGCPLLSGPLAASLGRTPCRLQLVPLRCPLFGLRLLLRLSLPERLFKLVAPLVEPVVFAFGYLRGLGEPVPFGCPLLSRPLAASLGRMPCRLQLVPLRCPLFGLRLLLHLSLPERLFKLVAPLVEPVAFAFGYFRGLGEPVPFSCPLLSGPLAASLGRTPCRLQLVPLRCPLFGLRLLLRQSLPERLFG